MHRVYLGCCALFWSSVCAAQTTQPASQPTSAPLDESYQTPSGLSSEPSTETQPAKSDRKNPWTVAILPFPVFSSDLGAGGVIRTNLYDHRKKIEPYGALYEALALYSSKGTQVYLAAVERPDLLQGAYRLRAQVAYLKDPNEYYGVGNETERDLTLEAEGFYESPFRLYGGLVSLRHKLTDKLEWIGIIDNRNYIVDAPAGSLVLQERPSGVEGGSVNVLGFGLFRDTRDNEAHATRGSFYELSARVAPPGLNQHPFFGASFIARYHYTIKPDITFAGRLVLDGMFGDVPFTTKDKFGLDAVYSLGGGRSLRGFTEGRYIGDIKGIVNLEARSLPLSFLLRGFHFDLGAAVFVDSGRVLADAKTPINGLSLHTGYGAGLRLLYEKDFLVRFDAAGSNEDTVRFYLDVGHIF